MPKPIVPGKETQVRFVRFLTVGGTAYVVQVLTIKLFLLWLDTNAAFTLSFMCSTATHYTLNRFWALPSERRDHGRQFGEYLGTALLSYVINLALFRLCLDMFGFGEIMSTAVAVPPSTVVVFLLLNYRVFRARSGQSKTAGHSERSEASTCGADALVRHASRGEGTPPTRPDSSPRSE